MQSRGPPRPHHRPRYSPSIQETVLQIIIDDTFALPRLPGNTKQNTTDWQEHEIPPIELSRAQDSYKIEFAMYREGLLIGLGRTEFKVNESRKGRDGLR